MFNSVENLHQAIDGLKQGENRRVSFGAVPSIAHHVLPSAVKTLHDQFPGLELHLNTIKIEEAIDYLLLQKGELVAMSYRLDHPGLSVQPLHSGQLYAILPAGHPLGQKEQLSVRDLARERLVGIEPSDPYGQLLMAPFTDAGVSVTYSVVARTGQTVSTLVAQGLGVAIMDELSPSRTAATSEHHGASHRRANQFPHLRHIRSGQAPLHFRRRHGQMSDCRNEKSALLNASGFLQFDR